MISRRHITLVIALCLSAPGTAQSPPTTSGDDLSRGLLNSERIAEQFGSYGIDVLEHASDVRVSNLYSPEDDRKICRTFAVVMYPDEIDAALAAEHSEILSGLSIGAVFTRHGWTVTKAHRYFGVIATTERVSNLMGDIGAQPLAVHVYDLEVSRGETSSFYATIAEVHHPDYLDVATLAEIYGQPVRSDTRRSLGLEPALALTYRKMN